MLVIQRGDARITAKATPVYNAQAKRPLLGFAFDVTQPPIGPGRPPPS